MNDELIAGVIEDSRWNSAMARGHFSHAHGRITVRHAWLWLVLTKLHLGGLAARLVSSTDEPHDPECTPEWAVLRSED